MRADIVPGARFPDYELPDHAGRKRKLSELQGDAPMIVFLSRGLYCPKDRRQAMNLVAFEPELKVAYAKLGTISTDDLLATNENRDGLGAHWPFLSDPGRIVQKDLDIQEYTDPVHDPMVPHTLVLAPELRVHGIYNGYWYWGRPSVEELRRDLREVTRRIRSDWDLSDPKLRAAWKAGDKSRFWPYGKSLREVFAEK
ncbi:MAG TPA: redoxin domain-containing protein [Myxococcales bacterium]|nr:redoxin domain-containing protein [Myxococcales bacterium]